jgi:hypothetical protein
MRLPLRFARNDRLNAVESQGDVMELSLKDRIVIRIKKALGMNIFLCDSCKWNWRSSCHRPERPFAVKCPDYEKRGK